MKVFASAHAFAGLHGYVFADPHWGVVVDLDGSALVVCYGSKSLIIPLRTSDWPRAPHVDFEFPPNLLQGPQREPQTSTRGLHTRVTVDQGAQPSSPRLIESTFETRDQVLSCALTTQGYTPQLQRYKLRLSITIALDRVTAQTEVARGWCRQSRYRTVVEMSGTATVVAQGMLCPGYHSPPIAATNDSCVRKAWKRVKRQLWKFWQHQYKQEQPVVVMQAGEVLLQLEAVPMLDAGV